MVNSRGDQVNIALLHLYAQLWQKCNKEARYRDYALLLSKYFKISYRHSTIDSILQAFERF